MSFTTDIKRELFSLPPTTGAQRAAALAALLAACGVAEDGKLLFVSENERVAEYFLALAEELGVRMEIDSATTDPKRDRDKFTFFCGEEGARRILSVAGAPVRTEGATLAYLRAAFLGSGSCTLPRDGGKTGYHLEFVLRSDRKARRFLSQLARLQLVGNTVKRGERFVVYFKSREVIADFLFLAGAENALKRLKNIAAEREENNNVNRVSNCFAGNADKAAIASAAQVVAFRELEKSGRLAALPEALRSAAKARTENPTLSLAELARLTGVTKSCLNHRIRKLMQIYGETML